MSNWKCRVCDASKFDLVLDLGDQPWGNGFLSKEQIPFEKSYPLRLVRCKGCETSQLDYTVPKEAMFVDHTYLSGITKTLTNHFRDTADIVFKSFLWNKTLPSILDIGSNDGEQLQQYKNLGCKVLGVESATSVSEIANKKGIPTINKFFNLELAKEIQTKFDVINASGVFFHLEELHSVTEGIQYLLKRDGVFVVQFIYMKLMQENTAFDQVYHEHLLYYTLKTIDTLLRMHNLELFHAYVSSIHGGSIIGYVGHSGEHAQTSELRKLVEEEVKSNSNSLDAYLDFARATEQARNATRAWIDELLQKGKLVYGLGAPVKGNTLLNYFDIGRDQIPYLTERNSLRKGLFSPGKHIPVIMEDELPDQPDAYLVLAWNFKKEILERHARDVENGIEFFFPVEAKEQI
jgi:SAM-dependent methyltransferase